MKRLALAATVIATLLAAVPAFATELGDRTDVAFNCSDGYLSVFIHESVTVGKSSYTINGDDTTYTEVVINQGENFIPVPPEARTIELWVTLNGTEYDPVVPCHTAPTTSTSTSSTTLPPTTTTTTLPPCPPPDQPQPWHCVVTGPSSLEPFLIWGGLFIIFGVAGVGIAIVEN